jgi:HlyD family secretion protein
MRLSRTARLGVALTSSLLGVGCERAGIAAAAIASAPDLESAAAPRAVAALGRLEPRDGLIRIAGPSRPSVVIAELLVEEGDRVSAGQPLAILDTRDENSAAVMRLEAELHNATAELTRTTELSARQLSPTTQLDEVRLRVAVARAELLGARAALERDTVRAPVSGQVIAVHARRGERVGQAGILLLARNEQMYAVAEVYETDVARVREGQRATVTSPALAAPLRGAVERVGLHVGRQTVLDTDPAALVDTRVVEVHIRLDESARAATLSNLQVDVRFEP